MQGLRRAVYSYSAGQEIVPRAQQKWLIALLIKTSYLVSFYPIATYSGFSIHDGTLLHSKSQYTTVKHSQKLLEHTYASDPHGLGTLTPIEFFQQDLLWQSSNTRSNSCSQKASKHTRSIRRRAIGPLAHHNGTSAHSPSLACHLPAPTIEYLHRPPYRLTCFSHCFPDTTAPDRSLDPTVLSQSKFEDYRTRYYGNQLLYVYIVARQ
jgi:hypothetical protein